MIKKTYNIIKPFLLSIVYISLILGCDKNPLGDGDNSYVIEPPVDDGTTAVPTISYAGATGTTGTINQAMNVSPTTLNNNGSAITNCTISPVLPAGLSINSTTCVISGTPTATLTSTSFTVTATNGAGNSTGNVSLTVNAACPTNYILVPYNAAAGTNSDFCVSKYEMKCVGSSCPTAIASANAVPTSQAASNPWVSISQTNSIAACSYLNTLNGVSNKYALISNEEWMTIARNIELVNANWSSNSAGVNVLARGHTDNSPANALAASTDDSPYYLTGNTSAQAANSGWEQKRTLTLSNSEVIWDFAGNVWEWVNWQVTPANKAYVSADGSPQAAWREFNLINTLIGPTDEMPPEKWASSFVWNFTTNAAQASPLNGNNGIGRYYAGNNSTGGAALRGGGWDDASSAGAFSLALNHSAGSSNTYIGFRCVFRP